MSNCQGTSPSATVKQGESAAHPPVAQGRSKRNSAIAADEEPSARLLDPKSAAHLRAAHIGMHNPATRRPSRCPEASSRNPPIASTLEREAGSSIQTTGALSVRSEADRVNSPGCTLTSWRPHNRAGRPSRTLYCCSARHCRSTTRPRPRYGRGRQAIIGELVGGRQPLRPEEATAGIEGAASIEDRLHTYARSFRACSKSTVEQTLRRFCNRPEGVVTSAAGGRRLLCQAPARETITRGVFGAGDWAAKGGKAGGAIPRSCGYA